MATGFYIASAVVGAVGAYSAAEQQEDAANEQNRLDAENRRLFELEADEKIRRTRESQKIIEGQATVQAGASGFAIGSSLDKYVKTIKERHETDIDWMRTAKESGIAIQEREAQARYRNQMSQSQATLIGGIGSAFGSAASAASSYSQFGWGFG